MNLRQPERRLFFHHIFIQMPLWEVWDLPLLEGVIVVDGVTNKRLPHRDFRSIRRRLRRSMARARARREWKAAH